MLFQDGTVNGGLRDGDAALTFFLFFVLNNQWLIIYNTETTA